MELESRAFDLPSLMDSCVASLHLRAKEKGLQILSDFPPGVPRTIVGDPTRLRQVVVNLLGNAIKFTERGHVKVSVDTIADNGLTVELHFAVQDSGIGIPRESHAKIFEAFVQADGSMTRRFGGPGLGLSICSKLVLLMGGKIWLESEPGQGSTFHFTSIFDKPQHPNEPKESSEPALQAQT